MSNIVGCRVDERLIHGQVATGWTNKLKSQRIMVIDNKVIKNDIDKMALKMACPPNCKLSILSIETAIKNLLSDKYEDERIFIVCKEPKYFLELLKAGIKFTELILGNISGKEDSKMLRRSVYVNEKQKIDLDSICDYGVTIGLQMTPADTWENYKELR